MNDDEPREAAFVRLIQEGKVFPGDGRAFDTGWDAAMAAKAEPVQIDRDEMVRVMCDTPLQDTPDSRHWINLWEARELADAVIAHLAAQPVPGAAAPRPHVCNSMCEGIN